MQASDCLVGHFQVEAPLGAGGKGVVYLAEDIRLKRKVALKFLSSTETADRDAMRRLIREAQVAGAQDAWQLHRSQIPGAQNVADERIANVDESASHWIKLSAKEDGSFTVTNGRTGVTKSYAPR